MVFFIYWCLLLISIIVYVLSLYVILICFDFSICFSCHFCFCFRCWLDCRWCKLKVSHSFPVEWMNSRFLKSTNQISRCPGFNVVPPHIHLMLLYFQSSGVVCNLLSFSCPLTPFHLGIKSGICLLIVPVPVHCFSLTFISRVLVVVQCGGRKKSPRTSI